MTLRPLGPSVTLTALLRISTPCSILSRASLENLTSLADMAFNSRGAYEGLLIVSCGLLDCRSAFDHAHDIGLFHDQEFLTVDLDFGSRPFAEQNEVTCLEIEWNEL